ncbi:MAG: Wzz/FepE/Etk N-terminal domain-containing protein [Nitrospirota bacterium]
MAQELQHEEEIELIDYIRVIWKRKYIIVLGTLLCMITAGIVSLMMSGIYKGSLILEVGKTYILEKGLIEEPKTVEEIIKSDEMSLKLKEILKSEDDVSYINNRIKVNTKSNPLIKITYQSGEQGEIRDALNFLANSIIKEHKKKYDNTIIVLNQRLNSVKEQIKKNMDKINDNKKKSTNIKKKIKRVKEQIKIDNSYIKVVRDQIGVFTNGISDVNKQVERLNVSKIEPLEMLFLQTNIKDQQTQLIWLRRELNDIKIRNAEREKNITNMENQILDIESQNSELQIHNEGLKETMAEIENFKSLTENTRIRSQAVVSERPIKPNKRMNVLIAGAIGLMSTLIIAFFAEYLQNVEKKSEVPKV